MRKGDQQEEENEKRGKASMAVTRVLATLDDYGYHRCLQRRAERYRKIVEWQILVLRPIDFAERSVQQQFIWEPCSESRITFAEAVTRDLAITVVPIWQRVRISRYHIVQLVRCHAQASFYEKSCLAHALGYTIHDIRWPVVVTPLSDYQDL